MELIRETGWEQVSGKQFTFERSIRAKDGVDRDITVDFLTTSEQREGRVHRPRGLQSDLKARTMLGAELSLQHNY